MIRLAIDFNELKQSDTREVARRLGLELNRQDKTRCFLHVGDKNPSLQIYADGWKCFGCGEHGDSVDLVTKYLNLSNVEAANWMQKEFNIQPSSPDYGKFEREHIYPGGTLKKVICRRDDGSKYGFWQHLEGNRWINGRDKGVPPLYAADSLPDHLFIVEGEKDVDRLNQNGKAAASLPDGSGSKWYSEYADTFKGRHVYIIQDNDTAGRKYAQMIAENLHGIASTVKVLDLTTIWAELPEKGDTSDLLDHMGDNAGIVVILDLAMKAPEWELAPKENVFDSFGFYSIPDLTEEERKPPEFIVNGMIPCGLTFISGAPKIRKSFFALQMAAAVATGGQFLGHDTVKCDVAYLDLEGSKSRVSFRAERMTAQIPRNVYVTNAVTERLANGLVDKLRELHRQRPGIRLIIIDTFSRARGNFKAGSANAYDADVSLLEPVQRMALEESVAVVFVHHDRKGAGFSADSFERLSGTMGISGSADSVLNIVSEGKRFDGKATLEYTPRDAKGGEMKLAFDEHFNEWQEVIETPVDVRGNPVCDWIIKNAPDKGFSGEFYSYQTVFKAAYNCQNENCGDIVRKAVLDNREKLFSEYLIGVQTGVKYHGERGLRLINLI